MTLSGAEQAASSALAIVAALLVLVGGVVFLAAVGVLKDELKGWIAVLTRSIASKRAALIDSNEDADAYLADIEGEIRNGAYRPYWVLGDATWAYAVTRIRAIRRPKLKRALQAFTSEFAADVLAGFLAYMGFVLRESLVILTGAAAFRLLIVYGFRSEEGATISFLFVLLVAPHIAMYVIRLPLRVGAARVGVRSRVEGRRRARRRISASRSKG